jgi:hypothetical protein
MKLITIVLSSVFFICICGTAFAGLAKSTEQPADMKITPQNETVVHANESRIEYSKWILLVLFMFLIVLSYASFEYTLNIPLKFILLHKAELLISWGVAFFALPGLISYVLDIEKVSSVIFIVWMVFVMILIERLFENYINVPLFGYRSPYMSYVEKKRQKEENPGN